MLNNYLYRDRTGLYEYNPATQDKLSLNHLLPSERQDLINKSSTIINTTFNPADPNQFIPTGNYYYHNTFKRFKPTHTSATDIKPFTELLDRLFPDSEDYQTVLSFIAHIIQHPDIRPSYGLLLTSESGTGKGFLYSAILRPLLSNQTVQLDNYNALFKTHSTALSNTLLVMLDDPKSDHKSTMTKLKSALTEPTRQIEEKFKEARTVNTYSRVILASNERVPLKLNESDVRRWYAPKYIQHRVNKHETVEFIESIANQIDLSAIYNYLLNYDLSSFNPYSPRETETLRGMLEASKSDVEDEIADYVSERKVFRLEELKRFLSDPITDSELSSILTESGFARRKIRNKKTSKEIRIWYDTSIKPSQIASLYDPCPFSATP